MSNVNTVAISGFLAGDPQVRWTADDGESSIVGLGVVVRRSVKNKDGEYEDESVIFDCTVFGKFANLVGRKLKKLDQVTVQGRLEKQEWEKDGEKRSSVSIAVSTIDSEGLFRSKDEDNAPQSAPAAAAAAAPAQAEAATAAPATSDDIPF